MVLLSSSASLWAGFNWIHNKLHTERALASQTHSHIPTDAKSELSLWVYKSTAISATSQWYIESTHQLTHQSAHEIPNGCFYCFPFPFPLRTVVSSSVVSLQRTDRAKVRTPNCVCSKSKVQQVLPLFALTFLSSLLWRVSFTRLAIAELVLSSNCKSHHKVFPSH